MKLLAKDVVPEAAERGWVVRTLPGQTPLALARGSKKTCAEREKRVERLLLLLEATALQVWVSYSLCCIRICSEVVGVPHRPLLPSYM